MVYDGIGIMIQFKFGNPFPDIGPIRIELFCLKVRIEDPKVWGSIAATAYCPLPSAVIGRKIKVK